MRTDSPLAMMRMARGMTQQEVADRWCAEFPDEPKTAKYIACWEAGTRAASVPTLRRLAGIYRCTVAELLGERVPTPMAVALAVVTQGRRVLLVQNRDSGRWQFPAGQVKPGRDASATAARECRAETGVHGAVRGELGERVHPRTAVLCRYFAVDYVAGDAENLDPDENLDVLWVPVSTLSEFIPLDDLFEPVAKHLGVTRCLQSA